MRNPEWKQGFGPTNWANRYEEMSCIDYIVDLDHRLAICGGFVRWMFSQAENPVPPNDIDVYCENEDHYDQAINAIKTKTKQIIDIQEGEHGTIFKILNIKWPIHLLKPIHGAVTLQGVLSQFDFSVCRAGYKFDTGFMRWFEFDEDEKNKNLHFCRMNNPIAALWRAMKYVRKGYRLDAKEIARVFRCWEEMHRDYKNFTLRFAEISPGKVDICQQLFYKILQMGAFGNGNTEQAIEVTDLPF